MPSHDDRSGPRREGSPSGAVSRQVGSYGARPRNQGSGSLPAVSEPTFGSGMHPIVTAATDAPELAEPVPAVRPGGSSFLESIEQAAHNPSGSFRAPHSGAIGRQSGSFPAPAVGVEVASFEVPPSGLVPRQSGALDAVGSAPAGRVSGAFGAPASGRATTSTSGARAAAPATGAFRVVAPTGAQTTVNIPRGTASQLLSAAMETLTAATGAIAAGQGDGFLLWGRCMLASNDLEHVKPEHLPSDRTDELTVVKAGLADTEYDLRVAAREAFPEAEELAAVVRAQLDIERVAAERAGPLIAHRRAHHLPVLEKKPGSAGLAEALAIHSQMLATELEIVEARTQAWPMGLRRRLPAAEARKPTLDRAVWKKLEPEIPKLFGAENTHPTDLMLRLVFVAALAGNVAAFLGAPPTLAWLTFAFVVATLAILLRRHSRARQLADQAVAIHAADRAHFDARQAEGRHMERLLADIVAAEKVIPPAYAELAARVAAARPEQWALLRELVGRGAM